MPGRLQLDVRALIAEERRRRLDKALPRESTEGEPGACPLLAARAQQQPRLDLAAHAVGREALQGMLYVPGFLTPAEEAEVGACVRGAPGSQWVAAEGRRMCNWGGKPGERAASALPPWLQALASCLVRAGVFPPERAPNHVLINSYAQAGGIPPHQDGCLYHPVVATLSLQGPALLRLERAPGGGAGAGGEPLAEVLLQPRCLLVLQGEAYSGALHSIACRPSDAVTALCCNCAAAGVVPGQTVPRAQERTSLVFVHKLQA